MLQILTAAILGGIGPNEPFLMVITEVGAVGVHVAPAVNEVPAAQTWSSPRVRTLSFAMASHFALQRLRR
ncbi:hypothetical protein [Winogradskya humida]|uniref:Uncharacterized protein n=1 Tax=Winogradskya humida TaxID=113566 RepID=A0ABQ4A7V3_9ACTN|nr:hypothetical protein [Actinoplanes humidus]GIE26950.1 hypothetical protein Ahu01nite_100520 [Actinoplanes humidus]